MIQKWETSYQSVNEISLKTRKQNAHFLGSLTPFSSVLMVQIQEYIMYEMDLLLLL